MKNHSIFTDGIILIKPFRPEDAEIHFRGEDEEIRKWLNEGYSSTIETVRRWIQASNDNGSVFPFAIWTIEDETLVGMIEVRTHWRTIEGIEDGDANISYCLYPDHRGHGYATRAVNLIHEFVSTIQIKRAVIRIASDNINSLKVPPRCGYKKTGQIITENEGEFSVFMKAVC